jgi:hypothetical protein
MSLPRTHPNLLILSGKRQSTHQTLQKQTVSTRLSQQWMRLQLARRACCGELRKSAHGLLQPVQLIGSPARLLQHAELARIQHKRLNYSRPELSPRRFETSRRTKGILRRRKVSHATIVRESSFQGTYRPLWRDRQPKNDLEYAGEINYETGRSTRCATKETDSSLPHFRCCWL